VNKETHIYVFRRHMDAVRRKYPEEWRTNSWFYTSLQCSSTPVGWVRDF